MGSAEGVLPEVRGVYTHRGGLYNILVLGKVANATLRSLVSGTVCQRTFALRTFLSLQTFAMRKILFEFP